MNEVAFRSADRTALAAAIAALAATFGNRLVTSEAVRSQHANTTTWYAAEAPDAVVFPQSAGDVQSVVRICANHRVPIIAFGAGSSLEGNVNAPYGGICVDFRDMDQVLAVHPEDFDCVVEPGISRTRLDEALAPHRMFFPVDPGADATLGGMASTRASGTNAVRYGTMKDNVLALKVVLANGELITTASRAKKSAAGYDLTRLFVGADGTLGLITELTLRLAALPEEVASGVCPFPSIEAACDAAIATVQAGIPAARIELLDEVQVRVCNAYSHLGLAETPTLFLEFHGTAAGVAEQSARFGDIAARFGAARFDWATGPEDRETLWKARHDVFWAMSAYRPGAKVVVTDACVPLSRLAECIVATKQDIERNGLFAPIVGHVGDGNFHTGVLVAMDDPAEVAKADAFVQRLSERAIAMEGTCTGEHGIGQGKRRFLELEHGAGAMAAMGAIKASLDPLGIMNPGKIF